MILKEALVVCFKLSELSYAGTEENHKAWVCRSWVPGPWSTKFCVAVPYICGSSV
jgi:hypothetical protein